MKKILGVFEGRVLYVLSYFSLFFCLENFIFPLWASQNSNPHSVSP